MTAIFNDSNDRVPTVSQSHSTPETVVQVRSVAPDAADSSTPTERLEASRARLRSAMLSTRRHVAHPGDGATPGWLMRLENLPGVRAIVSALKSWWSRHPLRPVVTLAHQTTDAFVTPVAQSHPIAMVSAGLVLGALIVTIRPWRWGLKRALFAGLVPQLVTSLPIDSWLGKLRAVEARQVSTRSGARSHIENVNATRR